MNTPPPPYKSTTTTTVETGSRSALQVSAPIMDIIEELTLQIVGQFFLQ